MSDMNTVNTGAAAPQDERKAAGSLFFAYDPDNGITVLDSAGAAQQAAQKSIDEYRDCADDAWPSEVGQVCWGVVLGEAAAVPGRDDFIDYELTDRAALPAQAVAPDDDPTILTDSQRQHYVALCRNLPHTLDSAHAIVSAVATAGFTNGYQAGKRDAVELAAPVQDVAPSDTANGIAWQSSGLGITRTAVMVDGRSWYRDDDPRVKAAPPAVAKDVAPSDASRALEVAAYLRLQHRNDTVNYDTMLDAADLLENMAANHRHPLYWYRPVGQDGGYEGPIHANSPAGKTLRDAKPGEWLGLYPAAQPAAQPADAQDAARYRLVRRGQHWSVIDGIGDALRAEVLDSAVDTELARTPGGAAS